VGDVTVGLSLWMVANCCHEKKQKSSTCEEFV